MFVVYNCQERSIPSHKDESGTLYVLDTTGSLPFEPRRTFYITDIPTGATRGGHAHKLCEQFLVSVSGGISINTYDGYNEKKFSLSQPDKGLYIPPMIWVEFQSFSRESVCLVVASQFYDETDYVKNFDDFASLVAEKNTERV